MKGAVQNLLASVIAAILLLPSILTGADHFLLPDSHGIRQVAITFDDLPAARSSFHPDLLANPKKFRARNVKVLRQLRKMGVPVAGFVTRDFRPPTWSEDDMSRLLKFWSRSGAVLGNHTTSHKDFHETPADEYFSSIRSGQEYLQATLGGDGLEGRYFRAPYLHRGASPESREQLRSYLELNRYQVAPVTIDVQDWIFAEIYSWADSNGAAETKEATVRAYLAYLEEAIEHYALLGVSVTGREAPHVALLHANALNYDNIEDVISLFVKLEFAFIDIKTALLDPCYSKMPIASGSSIRSWQSERGLPWASPPNPVRFLGPLYDEYQQRR